MTVRLTRRAFVGAAVAAPALAALPISLQSVGAQDGITVTMVTDTAGLGDQNFNDLANAGGTQAATDFGIEWKVIESVDIPSYIPNLTAGAEQGPLTVAVGYLLTDAITAVAAQYPDAHFAIIDAVVEAPNVQSVLYKEQEAAFLGGVAAGLMTQTNKIGIIGGQRIPPVIRYEVGFRAGVESVNPDAEVIIAYADSFRRPGQGQGVRPGAVRRWRGHRLPGRRSDRRRRLHRGRRAEQAGRAVGHRRGRHARITWPRVSRRSSFARASTPVSTRPSSKRSTAPSRGGIHNLGIAEGGVGFEDPNGNVPAEVAGSGRQSGRP